MVRCTSNSDQADIEGMFLYARLMLDHLKGQGSLAAITRECNSLPDKIEDM